jgi:hypothetical protein
MSFGITIVQLQLALRQPGCPICSMQEQAGARYISNLLWESVNDVETRERIIASLGYCPEHTLLLASMEVNRHGSVMGTSIIYEHLAQVVIHRLETWRPEKGLPQWLIPIRRVLAWLKIVPARRPPSQNVLSVESPCRVCQIAEGSAQFALLNLLEELEVHLDDWGPLLAASDGLCLQHLRDCLDNYSEIHPEATQYLVKDTIRRLEDREKRMNEYIRKHAWDARHEAITPAEHRSWKETLSFFSGYPPSRF